MKTFLIQSETAAEDRQAAFLIEKEMAKGDSKKIVWYSSLLKEFSFLKDQINEIIKSVSQLETRIDGLETREKKDIKPYAAPKKPKEAVEA